MQRIYATRRIKGHEDKPTLDIVHVWPNGQTLSGVRHESWVAISNLTGGDAHTRIWLPGYEPHGQKVDLVHGQTWGVPAKHFAPFSVVVDEIQVVKTDGLPLEDVLPNLHVFWELTPVKA